MAANYVMISREWKYVSHATCEYYVRLHLGWALFGISVFRKRFEIDPEIMRLKIQAYDVYFSFRIGIEDFLDILGVGFVFQITPPRKNIVSGGDMGGICYRKILFSRAVEQSMRNVTLKMFFQSLFVRFVSKLV